MKKDEIDDILRGTMADGRISRGERSALRELIIERGASENLKDLIRHRAFDLARQDSPHPRGKQLLDWVEGVIKLLDFKTESSRTAKNAAYFSPGPQCLNALRNFLRFADTSLDICVYTITDNRLSEEILAARSRGVSIRILTDDRKSEDLGSDIDSLSKAGIAVVSDDSDDHMHHKFAIADRQILVTGSYNWTRSAAQANQENVVISEDLLLVRPFQAEFDRLWKQFSKKAR